MRMLGVIPARGGSKGIPKKNIKILCGKPLIAYTIETALSSDLDRVIVSTDCHEIARVSEKFGAEIMIRPAHLAKDDTPTLLVLQDVTSKLDEHFDAVMTLQPTSPLRTVDDINKTIKIFTEDKNADSLISVVKVPHNYMSEKLMSFDGKYLVGSNKTKRRQDMPVLYARNGAAIYITKTDKLDSYVFGGNVLPYFMSKTSSFDIDDMEDWKIIERMIG